jgi:hypothetical protein
MVVIGIYFYEEGGREGERSWRFTLKVDVGWPIAFNVRGLPGPAGVEGWIVESAASDRSGVK